MYISVYISVNNDNFISPFPICITFIYFSWCCSALNKHFTALRKEASSVSSVFYIHSLWRGGYSKLFLVSDSFFVMSGYWILSDDFLYQLIWSYVFSTLPCWCCVIDFSLCIPGINPTCSCCMIILMPCLFNLLILFEIFPSVMKDIGL